MNRPGVYIHTWHFCILFMQKETDFVIKWIDLVYSYMHELFAYYICKRKLMFLRIYSTVKQAMSTTKWLFIVWCCWSYIELYFMDFYWQSTWGRGVGLPGLLLETPAFVSPEIRYFCKMTITVHLEHKITTREQLSLDSVDQVIAVCYWPGIS